MASYPGSIVSLTNPSGTNLLISPDHGALHTSENNEIVAIETTLGTQGGTNLFKGYVAGQFPLPVNSGGTIQQTITGGTFNGLTFGSANIVNSFITGGTLQSTIQNNGTINGGVYGTPTIDIINARTAGTGVMFGNSMLPAQGSLTDSAGGTLTVDARAAQIYYCVMGTSAGNRTITTPTNISNYQQLSYAFKTSGSANGTLVWGTIFRISQDYGTPTLGTGIGWNMYNWRYNAIDGKFDFLGQVLNLV